jgi:hypothetical protein
MHQAAIKSLGLVGNELKHKSSEKKLVHYYITSIREGEAENTKLRKAKEPTHLVMAS